MDELTRLMLIHRCLVVIVVELAILIVIVAYKE